MGARAAVLIDNPYYYDFANTRSGGGNIFALTGSAGTFVAKNTDVSVWTKGSRVYIDNPVYDWTLIDFSLTGSNLATISSSNDSGFNSLFGAPNNYSRMSGNNARPVVDDLRIPTNGDKKIYGHASVPEGFENNRDAWSDEVTVYVVVRNVDGSVAYPLTGKTIGAPGKSVYGENARNGMFEITLPDGKFLETGQTVEVVGAHRTGANSLNGKVHESLPEDILTGVVKTIDVTPPTQAVSSTDLSNATKQVTGTSDEDGAKVFVKVNGAWLKDASDNLVTTTVSGGQWTINLQSYLAEGDKVDIYLKDILDGQSILTNNTNLKEVAAEEGITDLTTIPDIKAYFGDKFYALPATYTQEPDGVYGNISEEVDGYASYSGYHDAIRELNDERFDSALRLTVKDVIPDNPKLTKSVISSGGATTSVGDTLTYTLKVKNDKTNSMDWADVVLEDTLAEGLVFSPENHGITIKKIDALGTETEITLAADAFEYNETTRLLSINVGDISTLAEFIVTFEVKVNNSKVGGNISNKVDAKGYSPQEVPFVAGPINPDADHARITIESNEVGLPGGEVYGVLELISAPSVIDFKKHTVATNDTRVEEPELDMPLTVSDNRGNLTSWTLTATLTKEMANTGDTTKILREAIKFNDGTSEEALDGEATLIKTHTHSDVGEYVVSNEWRSGGTGLKLEVPAGSVKKLGQYQAEITWHLGDTP
nr:hypothetical protein A5888_003813 [Enterococcus sp. 9E7_DIV0242]